MKTLWFIFTWLICHPILHCDQGISTPEEFLIFRKSAVCLFENGNDIKSGMESGAIGGGVGTVMIKTLGSKNDTQKERETKVKVADFTSACVAFALKKDPNTAYQASNNANVHNDLKHRPYLEQIGVVQEGEQVYEEEEPLSPRTKAGHDAVKRYDWMKNSPGLLAEYIERHEATGLTREGAFQDAYDQTERNIVIKTAWKKSIGKEISNYEISVVKEYAIDCGISLGIGLTTEGVLRGIPKVAKYAKGMVGNGIGKNAPTFVNQLSFKTPNGHSNSNFMYGVNRNVMPVQNKANGTVGDGYGWGNQGVNQVKQPTILSQQYCKQFRIYPNYSSSSVTPKTQNSLYLSSYSLHWSGSRYRAPRYYVGEGIKKNMKKRKLTVKISYESNRLGEKYLSDAYEKLIPVKTYSIDLAKGNKIFNPEFFLQRRKTLS